MKTIVLINDGTSAAENAAKLAYLIAKKTGANILVVQTCLINSPVYSKVTVGLYLEKATLFNGNHIMEIFDELAHTSNYFPGITTIDLPDANATQLAEVIIKKSTWLVINDVAVNPNTNSSLNLQSLLNKLRCPMLLVPENWSSHSIKRITYISDLRYCRLSIMRYLTELAKLIKANVSVAHLSVEGLPPIEENYGRTLFATEVAEQFKNCKLIFNNIREADIERAVDVIINGMHNDLLVLINHRFHFKKIIGQQLGNSLPAEISVPVLLFPY